MASGWGITGNKGRCYDFWIDFSECMSRCREPKDCSLLREDYLECLHHSKEKMWCVDHKAFKLNDNVELALVWSQGSEATKNTELSWLPSMEKSSISVIINLKYVDLTTNALKYALRVGIYLGLIENHVEFQRRNRIYKEEQRKLRAAARKGKEGEDVDHHA
ncbi:hypothetical protein FEM48_Zijuj09G0022700 [Ziziphus jujuba var. spinosa]|uniref:NADH dehydrogenase [ubiquinone] iron-sulfur protein 5-B-like n=1 Tax=Ziziphus jujuba var. spinosa TaxID=714518 RepID=A0A978UQB5_ZIZJJ|nr:hypothetical protein FEM48_Zijuj09G0022700 [Ziziphus jujuba var. spinosa]